MRSLKRKRPQVELDQVILHQDNAPPHRAQLTSLEIDLLGFERLEHSPYSPDLTPIDYDIFPQLKKELRDVRHADRRELEFICRRLFGSLTNSCMVPCTTNGSTGIKSVSMRRENTSRNFKSTEHLNTS